MLCEQCDVHFIEFGECIEFVKSDVVQGDREKYFEAYPRYDEKYFLKGNAEIRRFYELDYSVMTRSTSSIVVIPCAALNIPSSLILSIPSLRACAEIASSVEPCKINSLIVAVTGSTS